MIHLICGPSASGKTKLAKEIERERKAVRFSIDERVTPPIFPESFSMLFLMGLVMTFETELGMKGSVITIDNESWL